MTCPAAVGGQAGQRGARVQRNGGGTARVTLRSDLGCRSTDLHRRSAEQIQRGQSELRRAQRSTTVKWIDCYPTHTDERGNSWRERRGREGADACGLRARADVGINLNGRAEERGRVSPFRGRPNI